MKFLHQMYNRHMPDGWSESSKFHFAYWTNIYNDDSTFIASIKDRE